MSHRNARLTFHGRCLLVRRVRENGLKPAHVAAAMGVSRKCVYTWLARYDAEGERRSARSIIPAAHLTVQDQPGDRTTSDHRTLRASPRAGLAAELGVPARRTINRILHRPRTAPVNATVTRSPVT